MEGAEEAVDECHVLEMIVQEMLHQGSRDFAASNFVTPCLSNDSFTTH